MPQASQSRPTPEQASWLKSFTGVDIGHYADEAAGAISSVEHQVAQGAQQVGHAVADKATQVGHAVGQGATQVKDGVVHAAEAVGEEATKLMHEAVAFLKEVAALVVEIKQDFQTLGKIAADHGLAACSGSMIVLTASVVTAGVSFTAVLNAAAASAVPPAAPVAVPVTVIAVTTLIGSVFSTLGSLVAVVKCLDDAADAKKKEAEDHKAKTDESAKMSEVEKREQQIDEKQTLLLEEIRRLEAQRTAMNNAHSRLTGHIAKAKALVHKAPSKH